METIRLVKSGIRKSVMRTIYDYTSIRDIFAYSSVLWANGYNYLGEFRKFD